MNRRGYMILELVIALGLSSVIMFGFMQFYREMFQFIVKAGQAFVSDRKVCLLFNQLERDLSSASLPVIAAEEVPQDQKSPPKPPAQEKKGEEKQLHPFVADTVEGAGRKYKNKKQELLHSISFITLNSLETYDNQSQRLLRVVYELQENKTRLFKDKKSYFLYRKQTTDLYNVKAKTSEDKDQGAPVKSYLVADNIEYLSLSFYRTRALPQSEKDKGKEQKPLEGFSWGKKEETVNIIPEYALVTISLWTEDYRTTTQYECMIPLFAFDAPALPKKKDKKEEKKEEGKPSVPNPLGPMTPEQEALAKAITPFVEQMMSSIVQGTLPGMQPPPGQQPPQNNGYSFQLSPPGVRP